MSVDYRKLIEKVRKAETYMDKNKNSHAEVLLTKEELLLVVSSLALKMMDDDLRSKGLID